MLNQPKGVYLLSFVELWNRFSHYGMRALLVLYMVKALGFGGGKAVTIFAAFTSLDRLGGLLGASLADRFFGLRRAILLGGWIVAAGHLALALGSFFPGLALLVLGSGLFTTNINAFVGHFYQGDEAGRKSGYTLFYMAINIGALLATLLCAFLAKKYGWEYGFGLAAIGMVIGNIALMVYRPLLAGKGERPPGRKEGSFRSLLSLRRERALLLSLAGYVLFIAAEAQIHTSMILFADGMKHTLFSPSSILAINPLVIIALGALASRMRARLYLPFALAGLAFLALPFATSVFFLMGAIALIAFAEILLIPITYSAFGKVSAEKNNAKVMSLLPLGYALGYFLGGLLAKAMSGMGYGLGFALLGAVLLASGALLNYGRRASIAIAR